ncbi:MAG: MFS transporter, partial [Streptosporangiaceae bacterium]
VLRRLAVADAFALVPQGMVGITVLLVAAEHASMAVAALAVAAYTLGQAVTGPARGRLADRHGLVPVAVACGIAYALALLALLTGALAGAPASLLIATATAAGLVNPPLSPGLRSLWSAHAGPALAPTAFALDAAVMNLGYITGPVLASALATGVAPAAALVLMLALTGVAVVVIGRQARRPERPPERRPPERRPPEQGFRRRSVLRSTALRRLLVTAALANAALSATEVALIGYVRHHHALWASGPLLAELSIGSILGSLLLGARASATVPEPRGPQDSKNSKNFKNSKNSKGRRLPRLLAGYAGGLALLTAAGLDAPLMAVAAPLAGLCLGATLATLFSSAASAAPRGRGTETQAWINSIMNGGAAAGAALAGAVLAGAGASRPILALGLAAATAAAAAVSAGVVGRARRPQDTHE